MRRTVAVLVLAALGAGACSGSDDASSTDPTATSAPSTTVPEPATTIDVATTTSAEATVAPSTTVDDDARLRAAEQAYIESWEAYHAAILDPSDPELRAGVERTYTGGNLDGVLETLDGYVAAGYVARVHPDVLARTVVLSAPMPIPGEPDRVDMIVCEVNSELYFEVGSAPDGGDALVRDEVVTVRILARLKFENGEWRSESGKRLSRVTGDAGCSS